MRDSTKDSPHDRGEVVLPGRCQICGAEGATVARPDAAPPNQLCPRCAVEHGDAVGEEEIED